MSGSKPAISAKPSAEPTPLPVQSERGPSAAEVARAARRRRARKVGLSLLAWVGLPTLLAAVYYGLLASDEFTSSATLMLRGQSSDAVLVNEFLQSQELYSTLDADGVLSRHYAERGDWVGGLSPSAGRESRVAHLQRQVSVRLEPATGVLRIGVRAYSGDAAQRLAQALVGAAERVLAERGSHSDSTLVLISAPGVPDEASGPRRAYGVLTAGILSLLAYAIISLLVAAVREHAQF
jgi:capsule polysaccharide export protein KpsE/RkpR